MTGREWHNMEVLGPVGVALRGSYKENLHQRKSSFGAYGLQEAPAARQQ